MLPPCCKILHYYVIKKLHHFVVTKADTTSNIFSFYFWPTLKIIYMSLLAQRNKFSWLEIPKQFTFVIVDPLILKPFHRISLLTSIKILILGQFCEWILSLRDIVSNKNVLFSKHWRFS